MDSSLIRGSLMLDWEMKITWEVHQPEGKRICPTYSPLEYLCTSEGLFDICVHSRIFRYLPNLCDWLWLIRITDTVQKEEWEYSWVQCLNDLLGIWATLDPHPNFVISSSRVIIHCPVSAAGKGVCPDSNLSGFLKSQWKLNLWSQTDLNSSLDLLLLISWLWVNFWTSLHLNFLLYTMGG